MIAQHRVTLYQFALTAPTNVADTGGAWTTITGSQRLYQGHADIEDDTSTSFIWIASWYISSSWPGGLAMRIYDETNAAAIGPTLGSVAAPWSGGVTVQKTGTQYHQPYGPLVPTPLPTGDAVWRTEYAFDESIFGSTAYHFLIGMSLTYTRQL